MKQQKTSKPNPMSIHTFTVMTAAGSPLLLSRFIGRNVLVVNTASRCGYTRMNMLGLVKLQQMMGPERLAILSFPCSQFANQEPLSAQEWEELSRREYDPEGLLQYCEKTHVKPPRGTVATAEYHPLWQFLNASCGAPTWNFTKYLIDINGVPQTKYLAGVNPESLAAEISRMPCGIE